MKRLRIYIDTSVFGGCFDDEFAEESKKLFDMARRGEITLVVSDLLAAELRLAPSKVIEIFNSLPEDCLEEITISQESEQLRDWYLESKVLGTSASKDAFHVALATISKADMIVSWNFKHIVHVSKIRGFNAVNIREGYHIIDIRSPREVI